MRAPALRPAACALRTTSMSAMPLDGVNAVYRHDTAAREFPTLLNSSIVASAIA
jgi:hypothetical protein